VLTLQTAVELILAAGAAFLLARDLRRAWRDPLRRPVSLLVAGLVLAAFGLAMSEGTAATALLTTAGGTGLVAVALFVISQRREPRPWRADDVSHYERRAVQRPKH